MTGCQMASDSQQIPPAVPVDASLPRSAAGEPYPLDNDPAAQVPPVAPEPVTPPTAVPPTAQAPLRIKRTRTSGLWVAVGFFAIVLLLLLIFILQNGSRVSVNYMGAHGHLPLGVALLLSAVCGVLLVVLAGAARISQLRTVARRHRRADRKAAAAAAKAANQ
jgi:uncharacterized integral membrane protein